ncbi:hypothetical protein VSR68_09420 [Paraburkholderia phymatum]|uniref:hypothetical protein n=1 Tax=Paraburkholderia phymatum TaxID=148447 RepID=UPI00317CAAF8
MSLVGAECPKCAAGIAAMTAVLISGCSGSPSISVPGACFLARIASVGSLLYH